MLNKLIVRHFPLQNSHVGTHFEGSLVLATCQRTLVIEFGSDLEQTDGADIYTGSEGYSLLLEVICGLKSSIIAETEIVQQFKKAYREYIKLPCRNPSLMRILERLFKDAKKVRAEHLLTVGGRSYASICRKMIKKHSTSRRILVIGSGALAKDIIKLCRKEFEIYISARNQSAVDEITDSYLNAVVSWDDRSKWQDYDCVVNTIGVNKILFEQAFFEKWKEQHSDSAIFIDLGSPSTIETKLTSTDKVFRLTDVLTSAKKCEKYNQEFVSSALDVIASISMYRSQYFKTIGKQSSFSSLGEPSCQSIE